MKKIQTHIYIVLAIFLSTLIVGTFFDYTISQAIVVKRDTFGLVTSVIGTLPGYGVLAFIGGGFAFLALSKAYEKKWANILFYAGTVVLTLVATYFSGKEFFGPNGFYWIGVKVFWGYFIAFPVQVGICFLGYLFAKKAEFKRIWIVYLVILAAFTVANVLGTTVLKEIFHRPRFRSLDEYNGILFHNWYEPCKNYKELMAANNIGKEEFKSFPSGHASVTACIAMFASFLPLINKKFEKYAIPCFYIGLAWCMLISFARIRVGAHFMSDVSMGVLLTSIFFLIGRIVASNLIVLKNAEAQEIEKDA